MINSANSITFETFKTVAPLIACGLCFIFFLFVFKYLFKTNRYNPAIYICSLIVVIAAYFSFIKVFNLQRLDYFLDGVKFYAYLASSFVAYSFEKIVYPILTLVTINTMFVLSCLNVFTLVLTFVYQTKLHTIIRLKLTLKNIKFVIKCVFKNAVTYISSAVNALGNVSDVHKLNCVYSC